MKKEWLVKSLALGIIVLFIGVAIQSGISTNIIQDEKTDVDAKDYLFQTIIDIVNNPEIQSIIQKSEIRSSLINSLHKPGLILSLMKSRTPFKISSLSSFLTKNFLEYAYRLGVKLSRTFDVSKMQLVLQCYQESNQNVQKEINTVIENNANLKAKITQLSSLNCDCEKNSAIDGNLSIICVLLLYLLLFGMYLLDNGIFYIISIIGFFILSLSLFIGVIIFNCDWWYPHINF